MDTTKVVVLVLSILPIATAASIFLAQRDRLGLFHIWLILLALSYGAYTFVDVLVNDVAGIDLLNVLVLISSVTASMILTFMAFNRLPRQVRYGFSLEKIIWEANRTPFLNLFLVWLLAVAWQLYAYLTYGIVANYDPDTVAGLITFDIPQWVGPVRQFFIAVGFSVFIWLVARIAKKSDHELFALSLFMLIAMVFLLSLNGRRVFLHLLVVGAIIFVVGRGQLTSAFAFRNLIRIAAAFALFVVFSNVFQMIRQIYIVHSALGGVVPTVAELAEAASDFRSTTENLEARMALWRFHYSIMSAQLDDVGNVMAGELLWAGVLGTIPRLLYPDKGVVLGDDTLVCQHYQLICPDFAFYDIDYPQTLASGLQADFGLLFIILLPIWILAVLRLVSHYSYLSRKKIIGPVLYILVFGATAELLVNIEQSIGNYFIWARDIAILTVSVGLFGFFRRLATASQGIAR